VSTAPLCGQKYVSSSAGRAQVSKTWCRRFDPFLTCKLKLKEIKMENKWSKENLEKIVSLPKSKNEVLDRMGLRKAGSNNRTLRKYLNK